MYPRYLRKFMKNTPDRSAHFNSFNEVVHPLVAEVNKTVTIIISVLLILSTFYFFI